MTSASAVAPAFIKTLIWSDDNPLGMVAFGRECDIDSGIGRFTSLYSFLPFDHGAGASHTRPHSFQSALCP